MVSSPKTPNASPYAVPIAPSSRLEQTHQSSEKHGQQHDSHDNSQHEKKTASLAPRILLIPRGAPQLVVGSAGIVTHIDGVTLYRPELLTLLTHDLRNLLEEDVEIAHTLFNMPDLLLTFSDEGVLEVNLVLCGQMNLFLLLQLKLLPLLSGGAGIADGILLMCDPGSGDGGALFLEGGALKGLEFGEVGLELAREFLLGVFLRRLRRSQLAGPDRAAPSTTDARRRRDRHLP